MNVSGPVSATDGVQLATDVYRKIFDMTLPLEQVAEGYRAMDERRAIKAPLPPVK